SPVWQSSAAYSQLFSHPELFANLGFEALGNETSHPGAGHRKLVNRYAIEMSQAAHEMGRVLSYLTIPVTIADDAEIMDEASFEIFRDIVGRYAPEIAADLELRDLPARRQILNELIPKDQ